MGCSQTFGQVQNLKLMMTYKCGATFSWRASALLLDKHSAKGDLEDLKIALSLKAFSHLHLRVWFNETPVCFHSWRDPFGQV